MKSIRSRQLGVIWLFVMYLAMTMLFFWSFYAALVVFSITLFLCFLFRDHLPDMPYPAVDKRTLIPGYVEVLTCYFAFSAPVLILTLAYQAGLFFEPVYVRENWPVERIVPVTGADLFNYKWMLESWASNETKYDAIYLMVKAVNVVFFVFVFFVAHWFLGAIPFIKKVHDRSVYFGESLRWWFQMIVGCCLFYFVIFVLFYTVVGGEPSNSAYTNMLKNFYNNEAFFFGAFNFVAGIFFGLPWALVNGVLSKLLIYKSE